MAFIPAYPILVGAFFVCFGIFRFFQSGRENNDTDTIRHATIWFLLAGAFAVYALVTFISCHSAMKRFERVDMSIILLIPPKKTGCFCPRACNRSFFVVFICFFCKITQL